MRQLQNLRTAVRSTKGHVGVSLWAINQALDTKVDATWHIATELATLDISVPGKDVKCKTTAGERKIMLWAPLWTLLVSVISYHLLRSRRFVALEMMYHCLGSWPLSPPRSEGVYARGIAVRWNHCSFPILLIGGVQYM